MIKSLFNSMWPMMVCILLAMNGVQCLPAFALKDIPPSEVIANSNESITLLNLTEKKDIRAQMHITLIDNRNDTQEQKIAYCRKDWHDSTKAIFSFLTPADRKGIGFLTRNYDDEGKEDDQWLYMPGKETFRRVAPGEKNDDFMETDIAYSDLGDWDMKDYAYRHLEPEIIDEIECYHVELKSENNEVINKTGYARMEVWVRPDIWMFVKIRFYDKKDNHLKDLTIENIEQIDDIWTPHKFHVNNRQTKHQTIITFGDVRYNIRLDNGMFSPRRLTKGEPCFRPK